MIQSSGCDAWVIRTKTQNPETYAANWLSETEKLSPETYARKWSEWMTYFQDQGIEAVSTGMIALRRRQAADNDFWITEDAEEIGEHAGEAFYNAFVLQDFLRETAADLPDRTALVAGTPEPERRRSWTYAELVADAELVDRDHPRMLELAADLRLLDEALDQRANFILRFVAHDLPISQSHNSYEAKERNLPS